MAVKPQDLDDSVEERTEYLQIQPSYNSGSDIWQVDEETISTQVQANQTKLSELEMLMQALQRLTTELAELKDTHKAPRPAKTKKKVCWKCRNEEHFQRNCKLPTQSGNEWSPPQQNMEAVSGLNLWIRIGRAYHRSR